MSLRARMGLAAGVAVALAVIAVAVSAYEGTRSQLLGQVDQQLRTLLSQRVSNGPPAGDRVPGFFQPPSGGFGDRAEALCEGDEGLGLDQLPGPAFGFTRALYTLIYPPGCASRVYVPRGQTVGIPLTPAMRATAATGQGQSFGDAQVNGRHVRVLTAGLGAKGALAIAVSLAALDSALSNELLLLGVIAAAGVALAALLGFLVARTAVAPISRFTRHAERIADSPELLEQERLTVTGSDELARLAGTFNAMLDALERSLAAQRNLVADASHELRTPISTLRANLQLLRDEKLLEPEERDAVRADMIEELDELTRLVSDVVQLARGSKPVADPGELRLDAVVEEALARARRRGPGLGFEAELEPTLINGDGERIARAVTNLLDNAIKWSPAGATVEVGLRAGVLTVRDHGPGFHPEDVPFVFDRFHRARDARSKPGSGLGLAIVRQAAEAHGGIAEAANAADGGAVMRVSFGPVLAGPAELLASRV